MSLTFAKAVSIAKKLYFFDVTSEGRNNYTMTRRWPDDNEIDVQLEKMTKKEVIEMVESLEREEEDDGMEYNNDD